MTTFRWTYWLGLACAVALAGCRKDEEIRVYRVAKDKSAPASVMPTDPHAGMAMPRPGAGGMAAPHATGAADAPSPVAATRIGDVPEGWQGGGGSTMRKASYRVSGEDKAMADVSLIILNGPAGGALGNVNRWRGQLGQAPLDAAGLEKVVERVKTKCGEAVVVDIKGIAPGADPALDGRTVAAIIEREGKTWFFKMRGNSELVGNQKTSFLEWVASVEPTEVKSK